MTNNVGIDMASPVIQASDLGKEYRETGHSLTILQGLDLQVAAAESVAIVGSSGSGKTTLLNLLGGLDQPSSGQVLLAGHDLARIAGKERDRLRNRHLGFVYQMHHLLMEFSALENVTMPLLIGGRRQAEARNSATEMLERVGLGARLNHKPSELSGGERQRVAIARALVGQPSCVLMDEPTGNLDPQNAAQILDLMMNLNRQLGISFVVVTHDHHLAERMDRALELRDGCLHSIKIVNGVVQ